MTKDHPVCSNWRQVENFSPSATNIKQSIHVARRMQTARNTNSNQRSAQLKVNISATSGHQFTSFTRRAAARFHNSKVRVIHGPGKKRCDWKSRLHLAVTNVPVLVGLIHNAEEHMRNRWGENGTEQVAGLWTLQETPIMP